MRLLSTLFLLIVSCSLTAQEVNKSQKIDLLLNQYHQLQQFNGVALVAQNGQIILNKGYGQANFEWHIDHQPDGVFRIASLTKQFTAMLIMQLVEKGKIKLDGKISDYLPNYRHDTGTQITIRQLLNHTSGLGNFFHLKDYRQVETYNPYSPDEFIAKFCSEDLLFKPGTQFNYSNAGYTILGSIIEHVTKLSYEQALSAQIFTPAGMHHSGFNDQTKLVNKRVYGYQRTLNGVKPAAYIDMSVPYSAGSIYSTAQDLLLWEQALTHHTLLSKPFSEVLYQVTPHKNYAAGWEVDKLKASEFGKALTKLHHTGGIQGFNASITRIPEDNLLIVLLNNTGPGPMTAMSNNIIRLMNNKPAQQPKLRFTQRLYKTIDEKGIDNALAWYKQQQQLNNAFSESGLNRFGYQLLAIDANQAAIAFFKLNTQDHPDSENVYDSLADAYLANGDNRLALNNLIKAHSLTSNKHRYTDKIARLKEVVK
ncbi:serine hydrolase domain-containing protein [Neptunicella marina]|uniref:Beta-lactamase family protein n=1 Tax=Neptunicella marina TaxID=2125989 RepID=A0A8J6ISH7_9ALTE|nr:serine hydrolase domain-containing protein [Neptunicella marina]MBC3765479.1 beta-lactamase family protein [Neptunicella marina]